MKDGGVIMKGMFSIRGGNKKSRFWQLKSFLCNISTRHLLGLIVVLFVMSGCVATAPYNVMTRNSGITDFSHAVIVFGQKQISSGWVSPGNYKTSIDLTSAIPEMARVQWMRGAAEFEKEVPVKRQLPPRASGEYYTLVFAIDEKENVSFKVILCMRDIPCPELYE